MYHLNKKATAIFKSLVNMLGNESHIKIDNSNGSFMPLSVEHLYTLRAENSFTKRPLKVISLTHFYHKNGDMMHNPDMTFYYCEGDLETKIFAATFQQDNIARYDEAIFYTGAGNHFKCIPNVQKNITSFANNWLVNIKNQQQIKILDHDTVKR